MATFTFTPDFGASAKFNPRVRSIKFGDGYEQRLAFGINTNPQVWDLSFSLRDDAEALAIEAFLSNEGGVGAFDWTPPYGAAGRYICRDWSRTVDRHNLNSIRATFEQVFEP